MRQGRRTQFDPARGVAINTLAWEYPPAWNVPQHAHVSDQVIYATRGVMEVTAQQSLWMIPPQFAVWIPAHTAHSIRMPGAVSMRTLYVRPGLAPKMPKCCGVLHITPLLRELIVEAVRIGALRSRTSLHVALKDLLISQLQAATGVPTSLALPKDRRALTVAMETVADPAKARSFEALCKHAGVSTRTMERIFQRELGMDFETWRRQARLMKAVELLVAGHSVKNTAAQIGYRQASAFVAMFRAIFGASPKAWVTALGNPGSVA